MTIVCSKHNYSYDAAVSVCPRCGDEFETARKKKSQSPTSAELLRRMARALYLELPGPVAHDVCPRFATAADRIESAEKTLELVDMFVAEFRRHERGECKLRDINACVANLRNHLTQYEADRKAYVLQFGEKENL